MVVARAASFDARIETLFRPPLGELTALSPDGQRIAYTQRRGSDLSIVMMSLDPIGAKRSVNVEPERAPDAPVQTPTTQLRFLRWATATRLVFAPAERIVPLPPVPGANGVLLPNPDGPTIISPIQAVDADGRHRGTVIDARNFQETPAEARKTLADLLRTTKELQSTRNEAVRWRMPHLDILGFFPRDREQLIIQTRGAYSVPMQHLVDLRTGTVREFGVDWPAPPPEPHVYDWFRLKVVGERQPAVRPSTAWQDEDLRRVQTDIEAKFPRRAVELLDWSDNRSRILFRVTGGNDAGRIFVYQRPEDVVLEIFRRAPWLSAARLHDTRFFEFKANDGAQLSGYVTWPRTPRTTPTPLIVVFPSGFPGRAQPAFDPEAQVFADLGFAVARLNHRCVAGVRREDVSALRAAIDRKSVDDVRRTLDWLAAHQADRKFDPKRVVALGRGFGGYLTVRALQLAPTQFRCGIAIDAPMELRHWMEQAPTSGGLSAPMLRVRDVPVGLIDANATDWTALSVIDSADSLTNPVLVLLDPKRSPQISSSVVELRSRLQKAGRTLEHIDLDPGFATTEPKACATTYRAMEQFLNLHLQDYAVKIGPAKEVE